MAGYRQDERIEVSGEERASRRECVQKKVRAEEIEEWLGIDKTRGSR
jgi:hypothetical protein